jgi:SAM-dependent methyltransferase
VIGALNRLIAKVKSSRDVSYFCPVCETADISFLPLPDYYKDNAARYGYKFFGTGEMTSLHTYSCERCRASDRERLYALWLDQQIARGLMPKDIRIIHFAPESTLSRRLAQMGFLNYTTADIAMAGTHCIADLMHLPFSDASFDFFICSHVLEHVEDDDQAIDELYRITARDGRGILMAPIIVGLPATLEDPSVVSEGERWKHFGQNDHLRLYAHDDFVRKIKRHGFLLEELGIRHFGARVYTRLGLKRTSILYIVKRP